MEQKEYTNAEVQQNKIEENVFQQIYIPRTLQELPMEEVEKYLKGDNLYSKLTGLEFKKENDEVEEGDSEEN